MTIPDCHAVYSEKIASSACGILAKTVVNKGREKSRFIGISFRHAGIQHSAILFL
jgi:hypothetical protein